MLTFVHDVQLRNFHKRQPLKRSQIESLKQHDLVLAWHLNCPVAFGVQLSLSECPLAPLSKGQKGPSDHLVEWVEMESSEIEKTLCFVSLDMLTIWEPSIHDDYYSNSHLTSVLLTVKICELLTN